jgi:hypothetical protein
MDIDHWGPLVGHVERRQGVLVLPLDRVVELHHGRQSDGDWCEGICLCSRPVTAARDGMVWLRVRRVQVVFWTGICVIG